MLKKRKSKYIDGNTVATLLRFHPVISNLKTQLYAVIT